MKKYDSIIGNKKYYEDYYSIKSDWIITEKIHGANFSIQYMNGEWFVASRNNKLGAVDSKETNNFYNYKQTNVIEIFKKIKKYVESEYNSFALFGELYGGYFNGESKGKRVQGGIEYNPKNYFRVFDIFVDGKYLSFKEFLNFISMFNIDVVPIKKIFSGNLKDAIKYVEEKLLNTDSIISDIDIKIHKDGNVAEGFVIKPSVEMTNRYGSRLIIKIKSEKFKEKIRVKQPKIKKDIPEKFKFIVDEANTLININRLNSVMSKFDLKNISVVFKEMIKDVEKELDLNNFSKKEQRQIKKIINGNISKFVAKELRKGGYIQ